jgi:hypothetical protein
MIYEPFNTLTSRLPANTSKGWKNSLTRLGLIGRACTDGGTSAIEDLIHTITSEGQRWILTNSEFVMHAHAIVPKLLATLEDLSQRAWVAACTWFPGQSVP